MLSNLDWAQSSINGDLLPSHASISGKINKGIGAVLKVSLEARVSFHPMSSHLDFTTYHFL